MPLIHLPAQSGSNKILKKMNRKHSIETYLDLIKKLKQANSTIEFSSDFIIGYPGETEIDFNKTIKLVKEVKFINTYSFIFSPRPGTPASKMREIDKNIAQERLKIFQKTAEEIKMIYRKNLFNQQTLVMFENKMKEKNKFFGRDEFNNSVIVESNENIKGEIKNVFIMDGNQNNLFGKINEKVNNKVFAA